MVGEKKTIDMSANPKGIYILSIDTNGIIITKRDVQIFTSAGKQMKEFNWNGDDFNLDITDLSEGFYVLVIQSGEYREVKKLIVR